MKAYRDDRCRHMVDHGRDPDACKVLFTINSFLGETEEAAAQRQERWLAYVRENIKGRLAGFSKTINIDFSKFDLDKPLPDDVTTDDHQQILDEYCKFAAGHSIREALTTCNLSLPEIVGDGFPISMPSVNRRMLAGFEDGLISALQKRGLVRLHHEHQHLCDKLLAF